MQLRNLTIPYAQPAVFAPMAGFTDAACRHLMADHGAAWTVSEMASAKAITFGDDKSVRLLRDKASHGIYAVQLFGAEPETMAQAIRIIQEKGVQFDILDINMGCPAPKITSSVSCTLSAPLLSALLTSSTISADFFSAACLMISS